MDIVVAITLFVLALLIGVEVIGKVPATLHTPLMSGANSIHASSSQASSSSPRMPPAARLGVHLPGRSAGHDERGRRLRRHRPHAGNVQVRQGQEKGRGGQVNGYHG